MPYRLWIIPPIWLAKLFLVRISDVISHRHGMRSNHEKRWSRQECDIFSHRNGLQVEHKGPYLPWKRSYETRSKSRRFWKEPWTYLKLQIVWKAVANNLAVSYSLVINCSKSSHCSMCDKSLNSAPLPHAKGNPNLLVMIFRKSVNFESQIATCDHRFHCDHPSRWPWMKWCSLRVSNRYAIDVINMGQLFDVVCYILFMCIYIYICCYCVTMWNTWFTLWSCDLHENKKSLYFRSLVSSVHLRAQRVKNQHVAMFQRGCHGMSRTIIHQNVREHEKRWKTTARINKSISADPCRQQGERVREEITSSGGRRSVPQGPAVLVWRRRRLWGLAAGRQGPRPAGPVRSSGPCCFGVAKAPFVGLGGWKTAASFLVGSESDVKRWGPSPAGPVRPSRPCCFGAAKAPFVRLLAAGRQVRQLVFL